MTKKGFDFTVLIPLVIGILYAGTGGWTAERWNGALAIMGLGAAGKAGYVQGFNTYNPDLRHPSRSRDAMGRFTKEEE